MGIGGVSTWQLLIIFGIAILVFGTGRLKSLGGDLGNAIKGFRRAMDGGDDRGSGSAPVLGRRVEGAAEPGAGLSEQAKAEKLE